MLGPEGVIGYVMAELEAQLPHKLAEMRVRYDCTTRELPDVTRFYKTEPMDIAVDIPPLIVVTEQNSDSIDGPKRISDDGSGGSVYSFNYRLAIFGWATGDTYESTSAARQRYGLAIREILLSKPGLGDPDPGTCVLNPLEISESYSAVARADQSRMILAATGLVVEYRAQEYLAPRLRPVGTAGTVSAGLDVEPSP